MTRRNLDKIYSEEISLDALPEFAEYVELNLKKIKEFRQNFQLPVIGIAGAEGKTTTKGMLAAILAQRGKVLETPLDCNSASTVSSTLLQLGDDYTHCIIELGIINQKQFNLAVEISNPDIGVMTNIGEAQSDRFGNKHLIAETNVELMRQLKPDGFAVLNIDDELVSGMESFAATERIIKYGFNQSAHFFANNIKYLGPDGIEFVVNNYYKFHLPIYSATSVSNALAAIATARILGLDFEEILLGLKEHFNLVPGRGNFINLGDIYILDHTYNATINSVSKACESLSQFKNFSNNLILVLGSLDELENSSKEIHTNIGYYISALPIDTVVTVGNAAQFIGEGIRQINHNKKMISHCEDTNALPELIYSYLSSHSTVLMMGGKSLNLNHKLEQLVNRINGS